MKKLYVIAALLMASTSAHAGSSGNAVSFQVDGHRVHISVPRNCESLSCISVSASGFDKIDLKKLNFGDKNDDDDDAPPAKVTSRTPPAQVASTSTPAVAQPVPQPAPATTPRVGFATALPETGPAKPAVTATAATSTPVQAVAPAASQPVAIQPAAASAPTSPIGVWETEEHKGQVRIEACGDDLCGYAVKAKDGNNGDKVLRNMSSIGAKWSGKIYDPDSGRTYDSTIAMKGPNALRVQGCAFGGMFCGGQTWARVS